MRVKYSLLQLKDIYISEFDLEENINGKHLEVKDISVDIDFDLGQLEKKDGKFPSLKVEIFVNKNKKNPKIKVKSQIIAVFKFIDENIEEPKKLKLLLYNGLSIVYGFFRGIVFQKCSFLPPKDRILPTLDLTELIESKIFNNKNDKNT